MCGSSSPSPHSCARVPLIFARLPQAFHSFFGREGCGGGWKRTEKAGWKGAWIRFSGCFAFFSTPARTASSNFLFFFFFQLFNDERASRRRCCLSSAAHKSCAKLARRTPSAFFSSPLYVYDSGNPRYLGKLRSRKAGPVNFNYRLSISFHGQLYDSFPRA